LLPSFPNWWPGPRATVQIVSHSREQGCTYTGHTAAGPHTERTQFTDQLCPFQTAEGFGRTEQASPSGHSIAKLEETVGDKPLPHVSADTAIPAHATMPAASSRVLTPREPGPLLALQPVEALALHSVRLALAPCCTAFMAARLASLGWHVGWLPLANWLLQGSMRRKSITMGHFPNRWTCAMGVKSF